MLLDAAPGTGADFACAQRASVPSAVAGGATTLLAVFCGNADARSWAYSGTGTVASPDDPLFRELVALTTFQMIPPRDDDWGGRDFF
jgi:hypothetical protein